MVGQKNNQVIEKLRKVLADRIPSNHFSLGGYSDDNICIDHSEGKWRVYYAFRFQLEDLEEFDDADDAARCMIRRLMLLKDKDEVEATIKEYEMM